MESASVSLTNLDPSLDCDWLISEGFQRRSDRWNDFISHTMDVWWRLDGDSEASFAWYVNKGHMNGARVLHGGAMMTYLDHCMGALCYMRTGGQFAHTMQLSTQFIKPVRANRWVHAHVQHIAGTGSAQLLEAVAMVNSTVVAKAHGSFVDPKIKR